MNEDRQAMSTVEMSNAVVSIRECGSCGNYLQRIFTGKLHPDPGSVAQTCLRTCAKKKQMLNLPSYIFDKCFIRLAGSASSSYLLPRCPAKKSIFKFRISAFAAQQHEVQLSQQSEKYDSNRIYFM